MLRRDDDRVKIGMEPRLFELLIFSQTKTTRSELDMKYDLTSILRGWAKILNEERNQRNLRTLGSTFFKKRVTEGNIKTKTLGMISNVMVTN